MKILEMIQKRLGLTHEDLDKEMNLENLNELQHQLDNVRDEMIKNVGLNRLPVVFVDEVEKDNTLCLVHEHDGRDVELNYARKVFEFIETLWGDNVKLITIVENEIWEF